MNLDLNPQDSSFVLDFPESLDENGFIEYFESFDEMIKTIPSNRLLIYISREHCAFLLSKLQNSETMKLKNIIFNILLKLMKNKEIKMILHELDFINICALLYKEHKECFYSLIIAMSRFMEDSPQDICKEIGKLFFKKSLKIFSLKEDLDDYLSALDFICYYVNYVNFNKEEVKVLPEILAKLLSSRKSPYIKQCCFILFKLIDSFHDNLFEFATPKIIMIFNNLVLNLTLEDLEDDNSNSIHILTVFQNIIYYHGMHLFYIKFEEISMKLVSFLSFENITQKCQFAIITCLIDISIQKPEIYGILIDSNILDLMKILYTQVTFDIKLQFLSFLQNSLISPSINVSFLYLLSDIFIMVLDELEMYSNSYILSIEESILNLLINIPSKVYFEQIVERMNLVKNTFEKIYQTGNQECSILSKIILEIINCSYEEYPNIYKKIQLQ